MMSVRRHQRIPDLKLLLGYLRNRCQPPSLLLQIHAALITTGYLLPSPSSHPDDIPIPGRTPTTFVYNILIRAYRGLPHACLILFSQMLSHGVLPNHHTFPSLIKVVAATYCCTYSVPTLHSQAFRRGLTLDGFINCSIVDFYARAHDLDSARKTFDELSYPDLASCNSILHALCLHGNLASALRVFDRMVDRDIITWASLINGYAKNYEFHSAISLFRRWIMQKDVPLTPNEAMLVGALSVFANLDGLDAQLNGREIHGYIIRNEAPLTAFLGTALIDMYNKHGLLSYCTSIFKATLEKEVCTWNAMISALACNGKAIEALILFEEFRAADMHPNHITFVAVLSACSRQKLVEIGLEWFKAMYSRFGVVPLMEHYGCVVDILARAGFLKEAVEFIRRMPFEADASVWGALLGSCKVHEDAQIVDNVRKELARLHFGSSSRNMILRNLYAAAERWNDAAELKIAWEKSGMRKPTGHSWIVS
ncbi:putative pentatricopeptide repeat-containing protein At1g10330 [Zingiber officinale]|uniref:putative pentatricopeptide repeat-containing protein At1g10330 n=1 Tax=Zingiber officinale TaxID=94328 RepID=UPI001C4D9EE6|nr:putative pentatricopeptide repeat-containing protein At1g10330 [Zingiber officinale]XP_042460066.1 putative pentatricopeptide repeat-containing protein At1g10330 [Zingiber officinale]XP_042460067.1 putative pentatricopeptide repeat-containing protein At1g10330 [Zingiber officinale]